MKTEYLSGDERLAFYVSQVSHMFTAPIRRVISVENGDQYVSKNIHYHFYTRTEEGYDYMGVIRVTPRGWMKSSIKDKYDR